MPEKKEFLINLLIRVSRLSILSIVFVIVGSARPAMHPTMADRPNVLFIAIDDLNDWIGCLNNTTGVKTPNLDELAEMGLLFSNAHCSQAVCTASRNSLLSGLHPSSTGWYGSIKDMRGTYKEVMNENQMLPQYFRSNGYTTMAAGKIFHNGVSDYPDLTDSLWDQYAPAWWDSISPEILSNGPRQSRWFENYSKKIFRSLEFVWGCSCSL